MKSISDPRMLGAILNAPPFLSGLNDSEYNLVHSKARTTLHPEQSEMQRQLRKSLDDLKAGVEAARRLICERCELVLGDDGQARTASDPTPLPKPKLIAS